MKLFKIFKSITCCCREHGIKFQRKRSSTRDGGQGHQGGWSSSRLLVMRQGTRHQGSSQEKYLKGKGNREVAVQLKLSLHVVSGWLIKSSEVQDGNLMAIEGVFMVVFVVVVFQWELYCILSVVLLLLSSLSGGSGATRKAEVFGRE